MKGINQFTCKNTIDTCRAIAFIYGGKCLSDSYTKARDHYLWECKNGHVFEARFYNVKAGKWCKKCFLSSLKGTKFSDDRKRKISLANTGKKNGMYGRNHTLRTRKEISENSKKLWKDKQFREKILANPDRKMWCRNGALKSAESMKNKKMFGTKPELAMKKILKGLRLKFIHGYSVWNIDHKYMADFYLPKHNLIIEVDGLYWHNFPHGREIDHIRNSELNAAGYKILRFWENNFNKDTVLKMLKEEVDHLVEDPKYYEKLKKIEK